MPVSGIGGRAMSKEYIEREAAKRALRIKNMDYRMRD